MKERHYQHTAKPYEINQQLTLKPRKSAIFFSGYQMLRIKQTSKINKLRRAGTSEIK